MFMSLLYPPGFARPLAQGARRRIPLLAKAFHTVYSLAREFTKGLNLISIGLDVFVSSNASPKWAAWIVVAGGTFRKKAPG